MSRQEAMVSGGFYPGQQNLDVLSNQLVSVEEDAQNLTKQLNQMGFDINTGKRVHSKPKVCNHSSESRSNHHGGHAHDTIIPFRAHIPNTDVLYKNYDTLVSRLCRMESTIQGLKLSITQVQAERDLSKKEKMVANEKLSEATEAYEKEINRVKCLLEQSKKQLEVSDKERKEANETIKRLQHALEEATKSQSTVSLDIGELRSAKSKLQRRISELKDELSRESSLRTSLEESHNTLLARIQQMEQIVQKERQEVQSLSSNCNQLKHDSLRACEEAKQEHELRLNAENHLHRLQTELEMRQKKIASLEEDKKLLMAEIRKLQQQYMELNSQIDNMTSLINNKQSTYKQLVHENQFLFEVMRSASSENTKLISKYEQEIEHDMVQKAVKIQTEENMKQIEDRIKTETKLREKAEKRCEELEQLISELKTELKEQEEVALATTKDMAEEMKMMKDKLELLESDNEKLLKDKEELLEEVNQAVDSMTEERGHLEEQLQQQKVELQNMEQRLKHTEEENYTLLQRLAAFEDQQSSQKHLQQAMTDMMEQKNKLAYDKGRLQSKVDQLQAELESLAHAQTDLTQAKRTIAALEAKITKLQSELSASTSRAQRLETQLKQVRSGGDRKTRDFEMALKARDEAVQEASRFQQLIQALQEKEKQRAASFEKSLLEVRQDNKKMADTLESVMQSHGKLQHTIEGLQIDLGRKDNTIAELTREKSLLGEKCRHLQREVDQLHDQVMNLESIESTQVSPLRQKLYEAQEDNAKLARNMESLIKSNSQLQETMNELNDQLQQKIEIIEKLKSSRELDMKQHLDDVKIYEERLENLKQQLLKEREKTAKKTNKEIAELRRQLEDVFSKNGDLSRTNTELRHKVMELEHHVKEQKEKIFSLKSQVEHLQKIRSKHEQTINSFQGLRDQLNDLEKAKNDYMKKTKDQSKMIQTFMTQIADLQTEIKCLAKTQLDMSVVIQKQDSELKREKKHKDQLKKKYKECRLREQQLEELKRKTEEKLREANNESLQISASLQDAHEWFKSKFDHLQHELSDAKAVYGDMKLSYTQHPLIGEKQENEVTAEKAKEMIQSDEYNDLQTSRQTISRLADYAELAQQKTKEQLHRIQQQLLEEKARAEESERKLKMFQDASLRHTEDLAKELDYLKNHSWILAET